MRSGEVELTLLRVHVSLRCLSCLSVLFMLLAGDMWSRLRDSGQLTVKDEEVNATALDVAATQIG